MYIEEVGIPAESSIAIIRGNLLLCFWQKGDQKHELIGDFLLLISGIYIVGEGGNDTIDKSLLIKYTNSSD